MRHYYDTVANQSNVLVPNAAVRIFITGTQTLAQLFASDGITPIPNPVLTNNFGVFSFYVADGRYDIQVSGAGIATTTQQNIEISDVTEAGPGLTDLAWNAQTLNVVGSFTAGSITDSSLTPGSCVQTTTGGLLVSAGGPCGTSSGFVSLTGAPNTGNLAVFSGPTSISNGNLTGDVTTSGGSLVTLSSSLGGNYTFSGTNAFTGPLISGTFNGIQVVDGIKYTQSTAGVQAAINALPNASHDGVVLIPQGVVWNPAAVTLGSNTAVLDYSLTGSTLGHLVTYLGNQDAEYIFTGPNPGLGQSNPSLCVVNLEPNRLNNNGSGFVARYGPVAAPHNMWQWTFGNFGNATAGTNAMDLVLYGWQTPVGADTSHSIHITGQNGVELFNPFNDLVDKAQFDPLIAASKHVSYNFMPANPSDATFISRWNGSSTQTAIAHQVRFNSDSVGKCWGVDQPTNQFRVYAAGTSCGQPILTGTDAGVWSAPIGGTGGTFYPIALAIAAGASGFGTTTIGSGACASLITISAPGVIGTDSIQWSLTGDPAGVVGYGSGTNGGLTIYAFPTTNNVNFRSCNLTSTSITPGGMNFNWQVTRKNG